MALAVLALITGLSLQVGTKVGQASPDTFTVTSTGDGGDSNTGDGVCDDGSGNCTLRAAIQQANATAGTDTIAFNIPGVGPHTIQPASALPTITDPAIIDGYTQPGASTNSNGPGLGTNALLKIELNGSSAGSGANGLTISAGNSTVRGLVINRFIGIGIVLQGSGGNLIEGNFIGTDAAGSTDLGNSSGGIFIFRSPGNTIGGTVPGARNIISGNGSGSGVTAPGIWIEEIQSTGNVVQGNFIGTDVTGTVGLGNSLGVFIRAAPGNTIGGTTAGARNVISDNDKHGIEIQRTAATGNVVQGNFIGTDVSGTADLGNSQSGIFLFAPNNTVGGTVPGAGNVISGNNLFAGVGIQHFSPSFPATGNVVQGNFIGTDATATADLGNFGFGVWLVDAADNIIGGTALGAGNVISGNASAGIMIQADGATGNQVQGNFIGTDVTGTLDVGNSAQGVLLSFSGSGNIIGGTTPGARNVISGNNASGVEIREANGNQVQGNFIGVQVDGTSPLGNSSHGVLISGGFFVFGSGSGNAIGGTASGAGNAIAFNGGDGVFIDPGTGGTGNAIRGNSIFSNTGLGIDLGTNGVTLNDLGDANKPQNFPIVTSATSGGGSTTVQGTLNSTASTTFTLEFFSNDACDPSKFGEGQNFIGSGVVTTDGSGNVSFTFTFAAAVPLPQFITATATDPSGNTSEFSNCGPLALADLSASKTDSPDPVAVGQTLTYTVVVANSGPTNATGVTLTDTLPSSVTFVSATSTQGTCVEASGTVTCNVGTLANGASATVTITVRPRIGETITNTASVTGNEVDPNTSNNTATASTEVLGPPQEPPGCSPPAGSPPVSPPVCP